MFKKKSITFTLRSRLRLVSRDWLRIILLKYFIYIKIYFVNQENLNKINYYYREPIYVIIVSLKINLKK